MAIKKDCFAYLSDDDTRGCFALNKLYCKREKCKFYKERTQARKEYLDTYTLETASCIAKNVDEHFRKNL